MREEIWNPPASFRSAPFWAWNGKLEKEKLAAQIEAFHKMGFGGFFMHVRCGLQTPYLGEEFMEMVRFCAEEAEKRGMYAHLYDEDRYPSGHCGGQVTKEKRFMGRQLIAVFAPVEGAKPEEEAIETAGTYLVARYSIDFTEKGTMTHYSRLADGEEAAGQEVWFYSEPLPSSGWFNDGNHPDVLNPAVTDAFIELTHEKYKKAVGDKFGRAIPSIFTDEPNVGHMGWFDVKLKIPYAMFWSRELPALYQERYGTDLLSCLPEVFYTMEKPDSVQTRYNFLDLIAEQFKTAFSDKVGKWCEENNLLFTGHFHSEGTLSGQCCTSVDIMRQYAAYHIPGVDMLFESVELTTAKQATSVGRQLGRKRCMTELYGAARWSCDFRRYKMQTDWQTALGLTIRVPHLAFYSMEGESKRDYPACIGVQSPWYKDFATLENHFARTAAAMCEGEPVVSVGVIHPIETFWLAFGTEKKAERERKRIETYFQHVTEWLVRNHHDFDFISEAMVPMLWDGEAFGKMRYDVIVVPGCRTLRETTAEMLRDFSEKGGKVIFMGECPEYVSGRLSDKVRTLYARCVQIPFEKGALLEALEENRTVEIRTPQSPYNTAGITAEDYVCGLRKDERGGWLLVAPAAPQDNFDITGPQPLEIRIRGSFKACLYNTVEGKKEHLSCKTEGGYTVIEKSVYPLESLLIRLGEEVPAEEKTEETGRLQLGEKAAYSLEEENVLVLDTAEYALDGGEFAEKEDVFKISDILCETLSWMPNRGRYTQPYADRGDERHSVRLRYRFESRIETTAALGIEFLDKTEIVLNGVPVAKKAEGFYIDPAIRRIPRIPVQKGENVLEITMPFSLHIQPQVLYLLGDYGVAVKGTKAEIVPPEPVLYVGDASRQGLPFYGGNIVYTFEAETEDCMAAVSCSFYRAAALRVSIDGEDAGLICAPPYRSRTVHLAKGKHTVSITALGTRENTLAPLHAVKTTGWYAYWQYRPEENARADGYRPPELGILKRPALILY